MDSTAKKIVRGCFKPFDVTFLYLWQIICWGIDNFFLVFGGAILCGLTFFFTFIYPNVVIVQEYQSYPTTITGNLTIYTGYTEHHELVDNWVWLGFRNLGFVVAGILAIALFVLIIIGIVKLYTWSHDTHDFRG